MKVELAKLKMSHVRDFKIDPLEKEEAKALIESIKEHGFWGGVVVVKGENGDLEVAAGHKRVYAAMEAGETHADLHVGKHDDESMIRIYADENILQRGEKSGLAMAGAIGSAIKFLVKGILKGDKHVSQICETSEKGLEILRGQLVSENKGIGQDCVIHFFKGKIPESVVRHHIANLKASGDYARLVKEAVDEVDQEHAEEVAELERKEKEAEEQQKAEEAAKVKAKKEKAKAKHAETAETGKKAKEAAGKKKPTFDLGGVGKYLKTEHQIRVFRTVMEREAVQAHLPMEKQAELAAMLVDYANKHDKELTGQFIDDYTTALIRDVAAAQGKINKEEMRRIEAENIKVRFSNLQHHFCRNLAGVFSDAKDILDMRKADPSLPWHFTQEFKDAVALAKPKIDELAHKLGL